MKRHFCASVFVINPENKKILLVHHKKFNKWVQPGGHIEDNETPEEAALREVYEETGVKVKLLGRRFPREDDFIRPLGIQNNRNNSGDIHIDIIYAAIPINNVDIIINIEENHDARWFSREELENISIFPDIKITMDYILKKYF
ncbi:MAG: NUDIX hydrolase [Bacilli bacterium]|nr:NUDIX hydrolase [Bacilli bacterium]MDD4282771.1 NUDIX hydrolase [Bacilli bacterium]MDD4718371.1 NUDIX hydrolase [Bacilli bacterium]